MAQDTFDWTGGYIGAQLGGGTFGVQASDLTDVITNDAPNVQDLSPAYGIQAGYNWAPFDNNLIVGLELDAAFGFEANNLVAFNANSTDGLDFQNAWDSVISIRARAGVANGNTLMYVAAGPAFATTNFTFKDLDPSSTDCATLVCAEAQNDITGVSVGMGVEYAFQPEWVGRFEVVHYEMPTTRAEILTGRTTSTCTGTGGDECSAYFDSSSTMMKFSVSYHF